MRVEIRNNCCYPIQILDTSLILNENATCARSTSSQIFNDANNNQSVLQALDKFTSWFRIIPNTVGENINIGQFLVKWKRFPHARQLPGSEADFERIVSNPTLIPNLNIEKAPFTTSIFAPPRAVVGVPFLVTLEITNLTTRMEEFTYTVTVNIAFFFLLYNI